MPRRPLLLSLAICPLMVSVEVVDLSSLLKPETADPSHLRETARSIDAALSSQGFFLAVGTGEDSEYASSLGAARELFRIPLEDKLNVSMRSLGRIGRGYLEFGAESGVKSYFEPKEGFSYGFDFKKSPSHALQQPNVWPSSLSQETQKVLENTFHHQIKVAQAVTLGLQIVEEERNGSIGYTAAIHQGETISLLRLFHYLSHPFSNETHLGSSPHTDWGFLTVILHDGVPGLQFFHENTWVHMPYIQDSLIINAGDVLSQLSGGRYRSPIHRVLCPTLGLERYSFVLFFYPFFNMTMPSFEVLTEDINFDYNTLTRSGHNMSQMSFGDYIVEKWKGVMNY